MPILSDLQLDVEGTTRCETFVVVHVEVGPLLTYCEENNDVNLAVRALAFYLERSSKRWRTLADVGYEAVKISAQAEALQITHRDDAGHEMCQMNWALRFDPAQSTFVEEYSVKFTPEGTLLLEHQEALAAKPSDQSCEFQVLLWVRNAVFLQISWRKVTTRNGRPPTASLTWSRWLN